MKRISSNLTLFFKIFVPVFWLVFFGSFTLALFIYKQAFHGDIPGNYLRIGTLIFFVSGAVMQYFTLMRLKRVEADANHLYITNYRVNYRYPLDSIEKFEESTFFLLQVVNIHLKETGSFGKRITFIASKRNYQEFWDDHPELEELRG